MISTPVGDEVITTEGAKEIEELSVCSGDGYESSVEILDTNSDVDIKIVGQFISAKEARKLKKKQRKLERRSRLNPPPNLDGKGVRSVGQTCESKITCNNGLNCRQGVAVLSNNYCKDKIKFVYSDEKGRFLHVTFIENEKLYNIISLYAPNTVTERSEFFEFVKLYTENMDNLIIGGDFNTSLSHLDRGGKTKHIVDEPCRKLYEIVNNNNVYDVWRARNTHSRIFSWKRISNNELQQSRIDYFLVSRQLSPCIQNVYYNLTSLSDHAFVILNVNCNNIEKGPGLWILNNTLLHNEQYVRRVKEIITVERENELYERDILIWWDNLKYKIKRYSQIFSSSIAKENRRDYFRLEKQINNLCEKAANGNDIDIAKLEVLKRYGFGDKFIKWIEIFYNGINSAVKCNGFLTNYFCIKNGIRQGCPISALLYVLAAEPLHSKIVKNDLIKGIVVPNSGKEGLIFQHADDTTLSVCNKQSISEVFKVFDLYSKATGAKINRQKSEILCVGKGDLSPVEKQEYGLQVCDNNVQLLGVYVGKNRNICDDLNWKEKISKLKSLLNIWLQRQLTLQGRVVVVNTLMMSRFWYTLFVSSIPEWAYNEIKIVCVNFVWNKRSHLVKYNVIINHKCNGGLQLVDMKCKIHAFRLKFLGRLINDEYDVLWKHTFLYFVSKIYNMNLGLEVLFMQVPHCELKCLPIVYIEMLEAWYILRQKSELKLSVENIYDQPLFRNPEIVLKDKPILWYDFINAGIITLKDICYEVKTGFLPDCAIVEIIQNVFENANVNNVIDRYHCLICAIPDDWKQTVQSELHHRNTKRTIDISVIINHVPFELPLCTVNKL
ncbi:unnamed protein product [Mytilus edulis]|uniref:Reverse transcriptase domain-containing protein n=1 Tax=Mytilus edulis TaxID=6550 RepID=A0A8S3Q8L4_MYTED|nr:unnamed protein product [Mytilus edulis]